MWADSIITVFTMIAVTTKNLIASRIAPVTKPFVKFASVMKEAGLFSELTSIIIDMVKVQKEAFSFSATRAFVATVSHDRGILKAIIIGKSILPSLDRIILVPFRSTVGVDLSKVRLLVVLPQIFLRAFSPITAIVVNTLCASPSVPLFLGFSFAAFRTSFSNHGINPLFEIIKLIFDYTNKVNGKAQRPFRKEVGPSGPKRLAARTADDMVCSAWKLAAAL